MAAAALSRDSEIGLLVDRLSTMLLAAEDEFNALDRAIGDGDHGTNMARAARGLAQLRDELAGLPPGEALNRAGRAIVMSVGGASGPLYGTLLMETGKALPAGASLADWAEAFAAGVDAVARRGRSQEGDKTMLDVLGPAARAFRARAQDSAAAGAGAALIALRYGAAEGLAAQRDLRARRGRAAFVGARAEGADDPGAVSAWRALSLIAESLGGAAQ